MTLSAAEALGELTLRTDGATSNNLAHTALNAYLSSSDSDQAH